MATMLEDVVTRFDTAIATFYVGASDAISTYVMPIGWVLLATALLVHSWAIMDGRTSAPIQEWLWKLVTALMVLFAMSGGYLNWLGDPFMNLGDELATAVVGAKTSGTVLGNLVENTVDLSGVMFGAAGSAFKKLAFNAGVLLVVFGLLVTIVCFLLIAVALFFILFAKLGLGLVIAVGPFFLLGLMTPHTRNYFFSWLNTAFYFVFYQLLTVLFIVLFLDILSFYMNDVKTRISGTSFSYIDAIKNLLGAGDVYVNVVAVIFPLLCIAGAMFFMLLQLPQIAASLTSGSGGSFGNGLYAMSQILRGGGKPYTPKSPNTGGGKPRVQLRPQR